MAAQIVADVLLKTDGVTRGVQQTTGKLRGMASTAGSVFKGMLGSAVVLKGLDLIGQGVGKVVGEFGRVKEAGSNLQQSTGAVEAVFGKYTAGIKKSAAGAADALGLSRNEYQELASVVGAGLKNKGIKDYAGETKKLLGLGGDLAAQFGGSTKEAVEAISSLMRGETDPIERYGVSINETAISAELAAKGQDKLKGSALEQAKAQARVALLMRQTKDAQGAFARESDTLAGIQQRNAAAWENIRAKLGTALLPVFLASAKVIQSTVIPAVEQVAGWLGRNLPGAIERAKAVISPLVQGFAALAKLILQGDYTSALRGIFGWAEDSSIVDKILTIRETIGGFFSSLPGGASTAKAALSGLVSSIGGVFGQVAGLVAGVLPPMLGIFKTVVGVVQTALPPIISAFQSLLGGIGRVLAAVAPIVAQVFGAILTAVRQSVPALTSAYASIASIISSIGSIMSSVASLITKVWAGIGPIVLPVITSVFKTVISVVSGALGIVAGLFKVISSVLRGDWSGAWDGIKKIVSSAWSIIKAVVSNAGKVTAGIMQALMKSVGGLWSAGWKAVQSLVASVWAKIKAIISTAISVVQSTVSSKISAIKSVMSTAWSVIRSGVTNAWNAIKSAVSSRIASIVALVKSLPRKFRSALSGSLYGAGSKLIGTLVQGIRDRISAAVEAVKNGLQRIRNLLPGSPIKDGPLKSWNNGGAGKRLMALVAAGIQDGSGAVQRSMEDALQPPKVNLSRLLDRASTASRAAATTGAGSVTHIDVQLLVQPGATGAQVGAEFVRFVREYEQQTGRKVLAA